RLSWSTMVGGILVNGWAGPDRWEPRQSTAWKGRARFPALLALVEWVAADFLTSGRTTKTVPEAHTSWPRENTTMSLKIEDYAMIGNTHTVALVGNNGSIDWLCIPRFDSSACFAALLGSPANGHWQIAPNAAVQSVRRRYRGPTLVLENEFVTESGAVVVTDFMPVARRPQRTDIVRIIRC